MMAIPNVNHILYGHNPKKPIGKLFASSPRSTIFILNKYGRKMVKDIYGIETTKIRYVHHIDRLDKCGQRYL